MVSKPGDIYPEKIKNYIESADLFILCWSENAKNSDYVQLEIEDAMKRAYPGIDMDKATLAIHPLDIDPHAELPKEMNTVYNFGRIKRNMEYDVFISCKSEDYKLAEEVYQFLVDNGFYTFLSSKELRRMKDTEYLNAISEALDSTYHLIVLATSKETLMT